MHVAPVVSALGLGASVAAIHGELGAISVVFLLLNPIGDFPAFVRLGLAKRPVAPNVV